MGTGTEYTEFARASHTLPQAVRVNGVLALKVIGGSNAMHDPREFMLPLGAEHLTALRESLPRHVILMSVLAPLCREAGVRGDIDVTRRRISSMRCDRPRQCPIGSARRRVTWSSAAPAVA